MIYRDHSVGDVVPIRRVLEVELDPDLLSQVYAAAKTCSKTPGEFILWALRNGVADLDGLTGDSDD